MIRKLFIYLFQYRRFMWRKITYKEKTCEWRSMFGSMWYSNKYVNFRTAINDFKNIGK